ncbi:MAG: cytochrome B6 [Armatimonadetes bacterium]|nr:cytochrome B6 [Armatimonadota bacterium]
MKYLWKLWEWFDDRTGLGGLIGPMLTHPVPRASKWAYVFGSATLFAFILQVVSGVALAMAYVPASGHAYDSLKYISEHPLGNFLRGVHYFGASAMVILIGAHTVRVFLFASYKYPREVSWLSGVVLLGLTMGMGFTGQLLRWDQNGVWSVIVCAEMMGRVPFIGEYLAHFVLAGQNIGGATLSRFFDFHVFAIPALIFGFVGLHLWLVLRNGISEPPVKGRPVDPKTYREWYHNLVKRDGVPFFPDAAWRDMVFGASMLSLVALAALVWGPPELTNPPDPSLLNADPRPDWYLLWYFALLALLPHGTEDYFLIYGPLLAGLWLFIVPFIRPYGERHPAKRPWAVASVMLVVIMIAVLGVEGNRSPWSPDFEAKPLPASIVGTDVGPVAEGALIWHKKGCENCHNISGFGGRRGPDLTFIGDKLTEDQLTLRIINGGYNMPAFAGNISHNDLRSLVAFLKSRRHVYNDAPDVASPAPVTPSPKVVPTP